MIRADPRTSTAVLLVVVVVAGAAWWYLGREDAPADASVGESPTSTTSSTTSSASTRVLVHVAGAIAHPGVVEVDPGARVIDAIAAAGGAVSDADLGRVNLAAKVADGQRIQIPRVGEALTAVDLGMDPSDDSTADGSSDAPVNLNTATATQLEALPGIGPSLAAAIIDERRARGGFKAVDDLRSVRGIGEKRFADLRDRVTV